MQPPGVVYIRVAADPPKSGSGTNTPLTDKIQYPALNELTTSGVQNKMIHPQAGQTVCVKQGPNGTTEGVEREAKTWQEWGLRTDRFVFTNYFFVVLTVASFGFYLSYTLNDDRLNMDNRQSVYMDVPNDLTFGQQTYDSEIVGHAWPLLISILHLGLAACYYFWRTVQVNQIFVNFAECRDPMRWCYMGVAFLLLGLSNVFYIGRPSILHLLVVGGLVFALIGAGWMQDERNSEVYLEGDPQRAKKQWKDQYLVVPALALLLFFILPLAMRSPRIPPWQIAQIVLMSVFFLLMVLDSLYFVEYSPPSYMMHSVTVEWLVLAGTLALHWCAFVGYKKQ